MGADARYQWYLVISGTSGRWRQHNSDEGGRRVCACQMMDLGHHLMKHSRYGYAKRTWDLRPTGLPTTNERLDAVGGSDRFPLADERNGAAEPDACEAAVVEEAVLLWPPGIDEQVEALAETLLGRASRSAARCAASARGRRASPAARRCRHSAERLVLSRSWASRTTAAKLAVADAGLAAAGVGAESGARRTAAPDGDAGGPVQDPLNDDDAGRQSGPGRGIRQG